MSSADEQPSEKGEETEHILGCGRGRGDTGLGTERREVEAAVPTPFARARFRGAFPLLTIYTLLATHEKRG